MLYNFKLFRMNGDEQNDILFRFPFMVLFGVLVAFVLDALFTGDWRTWSGPMEGRKLGFTFTGWLLGVVAFVVLFGSSSSFGRLFLLDMFLPSFAIAQAIGRVGCFIGGCCYGMPCQCGVRYPEGSLPYSIVGDVALIPIQLYEAFALLLLFIICVKVVFKYRAAVYLIGVALIRFVAEFYRYDHRGSFMGLNGFSPQQYMSIIFALMAAAGFLVEVRKSGKIVSIWDAEALTW